MSYMDELSRKIGYETYTLYLRSDHWKEFCRGVKAVKCYICDDHRWLQVHHMIYERLGSELATDVVTVCKDCHAYIHGQVRKRKLDLSNAHIILKERGWIPFRKVRNKCKSAAGMCRTCGKKAKIGRKYCVKHRWDGQIKNLQRANASRKRKSVKNSAYKRNDV